MSNYCDFVIGASGSAGGDPEIIQCEAPAPIKYKDRWLCADHYDAVYDQRKPIEPGDVYVLD